MLQADKKKLKRFLCENKINGQLYLPFSQDTFNKSSTKSLVEQSVGAGDECIILCIPIFNTKYVTYTHPF